MVLFVSAVSTPRRRHGDITHGRTRGLDPDRRAPQAAAQKSGGDDRDHENGPDLGTGGRIGRGRGVVHTAGDGGIGQGPKTGGIVNIRDQT